MVIGGLQVEYMTYLTELNLSNNQLREAQALS